MSYIEGAIICVFCVWGLGFGEEELGGRYERLGNMDYESWMMVYGLWFMVFTV